MIATDPIYHAIADYEEYAKAILGKDHKPIVSYVNESNGERNFLDLEYGDKKVRIRIDDYNMMYVMQALYNNEVTNALLK